jgi:hypothetical protein
MVTIFGTHGFAESPSGENRTKKGGGANHMQVQTDIGLRLFCAEVRAELLVYEPPDVSTDLNLKSPSPFVSTIQLI